MLRKTIILSVIFFIPFFNGYAGAFGDRFQTIGLFGGMNYCNNFSYYNVGLNFDRFHKNCLSIRTYEGIQLEFGLNSFMFDYSRVSIKFTKGFVRPLYIGRQSAIHPVVSVNISYISNVSYNNFCIRPEVGIVMTKAILKLKPIATRLMIFYGYEFPLKSFADKQLSGNVIGLKFIFCLDFSKIKKVSGTKIEEKKEEN